MSVSGISSNYSQFPNFQSTQSSLQKFKQEFQQLGQDLQSGNLSQAQSDFAALQPNKAQAASTPSSATTSSSNSNSLSSAFSQLSTDLQSGNLSAAQQDFAAVQQDLQQQFSTGATSGGHHGHHHHHRVESSQDSSSSQSSPSSQNPIVQLFSQLGQDLQSGNLSAAQSAYASLQQDFAQLGAAPAASATTTAPSAPTSNTLNVSA